jgi:hypothetical protein
MAQIVLIARIERAAAIGVHHNGGEGGTAGDQRMAAPRRMGEMRAATAMMRRVMDERVARMIGAGGMMMTSSLGRKSEERR